MNETAAPRRLALIDRDGTIIVDKVYLSDPDGIEFAPARSRACDCCGTRGSRWS